MQVVCRCFGVIPLLIITIATTTSAVATGTGCVAEVN